MEHELWNARRTQRERDGGRDIQVRVRPSSRSSVPQGWLYGAPQHEYSALALILQLGLWLDSNLRVLNVQCRCRTARNKWGRTVSVSAFWLHTGSGPCRPQDGRSFIKYSNVFLWTHFLKGAKTIQPKFVDFPRLGEEFTLCTFTTTPFLVECNSTLDLIPLLQSTQWCCKQRTKHSAADIPGGHYLIIINIQPRNAAWQKKKNDKEIKIFSY